MYINDNLIPVKRLQLNVGMGRLVEVPKSKLFLRGPIPLDWLEVAAKLPGKSLNIAIALWWLHGLNKSSPLKLTKKSLEIMNVKRDAQRTALIHLENAGLISVVRKLGQRPIVCILDLSKNSLNQSN